VIEGNDHDNAHEQGDCDECVAEKPEGFAAKVTERFALRDVSSVRHGYQKLDYFNGCCEETACCYVFRVMWLAA
jgi:hypothetical protein